MESFLNKLKDITTFIFDVDGVLTDGSVFVAENGEQSRAFNIKDGYAIQLAVKCGYQVCVISGSRSKSAVYRLNSLGVTDVYMGTHTKTERLKVYLEEKATHASNVLYMGDDIPDLGAMHLAGLPTCPADAVEEIKAASQYVSPYAGGKGCARDVIEKVLKIQGKWMSEQAYSW
ncbi:3-deoxy-D-manno-octulosonate 8-phosphate phosphatase (KDO 8-P phosphatase) [Mucilaginibacter mallensis]|uniref:3-deoxy-D-manno-octulosonate 8-phosphate phosphatase (KDO 8-P phosphatase) n=1 Tax=Mucilaginibacter mallensis TaxID=652787 RepID=A0A1H1X2L1_MUCMA|nr:HAD-IIIA family hydrolase [Mucilaginibacter mallensis]SDT02789.1 3-deoxy-D-manno-octulosonate 8-phosphate phosphatase (KDO 8-P phosphatase) [Mucilaginibacter mallensis]